MAACWGILGATASLLISRPLAKISLGIKLLKWGYGADWILLEIENICEKMNLPMPQVGIYPADEVNAFAIGFSKKLSLIAISDRLLMHLDRSEVRAILAHELSHIKSGDMATIGLLQGAVESFTLFTSRAIGLLYYYKNKENDLAPVFAIMIAFLLEVAFALSGVLLMRYYSRNREYRADLEAAKIVGFDTMIRAIKTISTPSVYDSDLSYSQLKFSSSLTNGLFATHPTPEERVKYLQDYKRRLTNATPKVRPQPPEAIFK